MQMPHGESLFCKALQLSDVTTFYSMEDASLFHSSCEETVGGLLSFRTTKKDFSHNNLHPLRSLPQDGGHAKAQTMEGYKGIW